MAEVFADLPSMQTAVAGRDKDAVRRVLAVLVESQPSIDRAFVTDPNGVLWSDYPHATESEGQSLDYRDWYQGVKRKWQPYVSKVYQRHVNPQDLVVAIATPIRRDDQVIGILVYHIRLEAMNNWLQDIRLGDKGYVFLVDHVGNVAAHPALDFTGEEYEAYAGLEVLQRALHGEQRVVNYKDPLNGQAMVASFAPLRIAPDQYWVLVAQQPTAEAYAPIRQLQTLLGIAAGILTLAAIFIVGAMGRTQRWLQESNENLDREITQRQRYEKQIREAEQFLASVVENIPDMIFVKRGRSSIRAA